MTENKSKLFLLDALALIYRAHFAFSKNPRINSKGLNTGAVFGFTNALLEIIYKEKPTHLAVAFDTSAPTFRHESFPEYKAHRESQPEEINVAIPLCKEMIRGFGIPILEKDGFEADDIIGTLATRFGTGDFEVYMMTPDKDYAQLVNEHVFLYKPAFMGNGVEILGVKEVLEKFDIQTVSQVIDFLGLKGDAVDNIPGIPGIGDKTATKLLKEFGTVENLVANSDQLTGSLQQKVKEFGSQGLKSKELATIYTQVPIEVSIEELAYTGPEKDRLVPLLEELEFRTISKRIFGETINPQAPQTQQLNLFSLNTNEEKPAVNTSRSSFNTVHHHYIIADTEDLIHDLLNRLKSSASFCFDTETTSLETVEAELVGVSFCMKTNEAWYVPIPENKEEALSIVGLFKNILEDQTKEKIGQNLKFDIQVLKNYNIQVSGPLFDTMLAHYLIDPETTHSMDVLAEIYLNYTPIPIEDLIGPKGKNQKNMREVSIDQVAVYAAEDADITWQLKLKLEPEIKRLGLEKLLHEVEEPLSFVLADMEYNGVSIDPKSLHAMSHELDSLIKKAEKEVYEIAGESFNIGSPKQLGVILFEKLKVLDSPKKTKTGQYATGEDILSRLAGQHPIADKILEFREYQKLKSTYVDALPRMISKKDHRVHTDYRQTVAVTGRLSSNNPNLQNIPIRTVKGREIRKAFVPKNDQFTIFSADYSQVELRIMASFSGDESMKEAFRAGRDIHANTASKVFKVSLDQVDGTMRRKAKEVNFGIIYGISAHGLSQNLNISRGEAQEIIQSYFTEFPAVKTYMDSCIESAREKEYVETILGRRRYLRNINSRNFTMRGFDERNAINAPIQGSAADIIKVAMIQIHDWMKKTNVKSTMIMQVHDELVFELHEDERSFFPEKVEYFMKTALPLQVPLEVGIGIGQNWLEAH